jgi:hypothetical protein
MNRLLTYTAVGLFLGLAPAVAETDNPVNESQMPPAMQEPSAPASPTEAVPLDPQEPGAPIPGDTTQVTPGAEQPNPAEPPAQSEAQKSMTPSEAPPVDSTALAGDRPQFLSKQERSDWLSSNLVGVSVNNAANENIGSITDLIADEDGKVIGVLIGSGGFLGIGQKDVAVRFEDLKLARDENNDVTALVNISKDALTAAPDYETLTEQQMTVGSEQERPAPGL